MKLFKIFWLIVFIAACGEIDPEKKQGIRFLATDGETGFLHLNLAQSEDPRLRQAGTITHYRVRIETEGGEPMEQILSAEAGGFLAEGIPGGLYRSIQVWALNEAGQILREGRLENVTITPGQQQMLEIILRPIPLILNLVEGAHLSNRRLYFAVLTDPDHPIGVRTSRALRDQRQASETILTDAQGLARFYPETLAAGSYTFEVIDFHSNQSAQLSLTLWDGQTIQAAPLLAGSLSRQGSLSSLGGVYLPNVAEVLWRP